MMPEQEKPSPEPTLRVPAGRRLRPLPVRIMHWINAAVMLENIAQINPIGRRLSEAAVPSTTKVAIGAVRLLIIIQEG